MDEILNLIESVSEGFPFYSLDGTFIQSSFKAFICKDGRETKTNFSLKIPKHQAINHTKLQCV